MIEFQTVTKKYGARTVLDEVSFIVKPGRVTAFLGPNGSGKTTTLKILLGLETVDSGLATIDDVSYVKLANPMFKVGALLDGRSAHPGRSAIHHLQALAMTHGISKARIHEVLELVGLSDVAKVKVGKFSLGMSQRLGIAAAMLGDPSTYIFDEPLNGLDPDGVKWFRDLVKGFAAEGRTVFLSSHLISEVAITADHVVLIGQGKILADEPLAELESKGNSLEDVYLKLTDSSLEYRTSRS